MLCAAVTFTVYTEIPLKTLDTGEEFKPIFASPGKAIPVIPPKGSEKKHRV